VSATDRIPAFVPEGFDSHLEYVLSEAEVAFLKGRTGEGIISLLHAVHVAATKGEPLPDGPWFNDICRASKAWEL
jgi:hypothetical protein